MMIKSGYTTVDVFYYNIKHLVFFCTELSGYLADTPITTKADANVKAVWPPH